MALSEFGIQGQAAMAMLTQSNWFTQISSRLVQYQRLLMAMGGCAQASADQGSGINPGPDEYVHGWMAWMHASMDGV